MNFFSFFIIATIAILSIFVFPTSESAIIFRNKRQSYGVVNNIVNDGLFGGPASLGWAQVPHVMSPMVAPVFGRK